MNGGVSGEVSGEVFRHHLTIGKADKQGDSVHFGEVSPHFQQDFFCGSRLSSRYSQHACRRCLLSLSETIPEQVRDGFRACQRPSLTMSLTISIELVVAKSQSPFLLYSVDIKIKTFSTQSSIVYAALREIIISTEYRRKGGAAP